MKKTNKTGGSQEQTRFAETAQMKSWLPWVVILFVGLLGWAITSRMSFEKNMVSVKTDAVAQRIKASVVVTSSEAVQSAIGSPGAVDRMNQFRKQVSDDVSLLQRGGFYSISDSSPVPAADPQKVPVAALVTQLETFDKAAQPITSSSETLKKAADAESNIPSAVSSLSEISSKLAQSKNASSGVWGDAINPVRADLSRRELIGIESLIANNPTSPASKQWQVMIEARAKEAATLSDLAGKDSRLNSDEKALISEMATQSAILADGFRALTEGSNEKSAAKSAIPAVRKASSDLVKAADDVAKAASAPISPILEYSVYLFMLISAVGFFGSIFAFWSMTGNLWQLKHQGSKGAALASSTERVQRTLRQIIMRETSVTRINESSESPLFVLSSLINQILTQRDQAVEIMNSSGALLEDGVIGVESVSTIMALHGEEQVSSLDQSEGRMSLSASRLARMVQDMENIQASSQRSIELSHRGAALIQENAWKMEAVRENTQRTSKRIKRLGEGTQSLSSSVDMIKEAIKKIKVIGMNVAIDAAAQGESGRAFADLARELERLVHSANQASQEVVTKIDELQGDAKETVAAMEENTADVVESAKISTELSLLFKDVDKFLEKIISGTNVSVKLTEEVSLSLINEASSIQDVKKAATSISGLSSKNRSHSENLRAAVTDIKKWLNSVGKNI